MCTCVWGGVRGGKGGFTFIHVFMCAYMCVCVCVRVRVRVCRDEREQTICD